VLGLEIHFEILKENRKECIYGRGGIESPNMLTKRSAHRSYDLIHLGTSPFHPRYNSLKN
jgi:hypothetical protein